jgi:protein gp37
MGENTNIEWADHTFNPWVGCSKISSACDYCYAESWAKRSGHPELWQGERRRTAGANWQRPIKWNRQAATAGKRARVFCASLADVFDNQVPRRWRDDLWHRIDQTPHLDWLLLTKRPQNIAKMLPDPETGVSRGAMAGQTSGWACQRETRRKQTGTSRSCWRRRPQCGSLAWSRCWSRLISTTS